MKQIKSYIIMLTVTLFLVLSFPFLSEPAHAATTTVTSISVAPPSNPIYLKQTFQIKATIITTPKNTIAKPTYTSSNLKVATINKEGLLTAVGVGQSSIKVSAGNKSALILVTVKSKVKQLSLSVSKTTIAVGEQAKLDSQIIMNDKLPNSAVSYKVTDPSVLFLDDQRQITALKEGMTDIIVNANEKSAKVTITVSDMNWSLKNEINKNSNITWSKNGKYVAIDQLITDTGKGQVIKEMNSESMFSQNTLYSFEYQSVTAYDNNFKPTKTYDLTEDQYTQIPWGQADKAFSEDGKYLFYKPSEYEPVTLIDLTTGEPQKKYPSKTDYNKVYGPISISLGKDTTQHLLFLNVINNNEGVIFDTSDGSIITTIKAYGNAVFSADAKQIAIYHNSLLQLWNTETGTLIQEMQGSFNDVDFSVDGRFLAAANEDGNVDIYDAKSFELIKTLATKSTLKHKKLGEGFNIPQNVSFSPDGKQLVATYSTWRNSEEPGIISWNISQIGN